jgi:tetratricopeptide (TPR) repeat protein
VNLSKRKIIMESSLYIGRKVIKQVLKSLLAAAFGKNPGQGTDSAVPRLFLLYGADGAGKSTLIDICMRNINELGAGSDRPAAWVLVDLDVARFRTGELPFKPGVMLDAIFKTALASHEHIASLLSPFERLRQKINDINWRKQLLIDTEWPRELFLGATPLKTAGDKGTDGMATAESAPVSPPEARFTSWIKTKIDPGDLALADSADESLTALLADCLVNASLKIPFAMIIDGIELIEGEVERWLRDTFLPLLVNRDSGLAIILSGNDRGVRSFRNAFAEQLVFTYPLAALSLTLSDIVELAAARNIALAPVQAAQIELATAGTPIAVQSFLDYAAMKVPITDILPAQADVDSGRMVDSLVDRFTRQGDDVTRVRIFSLTLCYRFDQNLFAKLWGISAGEVALAVADIADRHSFLLADGRLHEAFRNRLRPYLIAELARGADSPLSTFLKKFAAVQAEHQAAEVERKASQITDPFVRYADQTFQSALLGYRYSLALSSPIDLLHALPGFFIEALVYNAELAARLLEFEKELKPLLPHDLQPMINQLRVGLPIAKEVFAPLIPGSRDNVKALSFMENFQSSLGETQRALLHRLRGRLLSHAGNFQKAVEEFETAMRLLGESMPGRSALFGDFMAAGYAFIKANDTKKAIDAFTTAVSLRSGDFFAWMELARMQQLIGKHRAAIESYEAVVRINPEAKEAWFELGRECAFLSEHSRAVEVFNRVTQLDAKHALAWFNCAVSLESLSRYAEAQEAANKALAVASDHWEALFVLGRVLAAQNYSREAIDTFNKVVAIKPDCWEAWEALGRQLLGIESFEDAAGALEKAAALGGKSAQLWHAIGTAWYGVANYENSVRACQKATGLRMDFFDAWVMLGHGFTGMKDFKSACAAFQAAARINPADPQIWVEVGNSLYTLNEFQAAIEAFLKATELRSDTDAIWLSIGKAFQAQKKFTEAVDSFQKSIARNPNDSEAWFQQGWSYAMLGCYDDAAASFAKTVELTPDAGEAWYQHGLSLAATGKHAEAITSFFKATESLPSDSEVWFQLGLSQMATGSGESAAAAFLRSIECGADRPEAHHQLGLARESLGSYEEAIASFQQAILHSPNFTDSLLHLGICFNTVGRYAEAADSLGKVREIDPGNHDALLPLAFAFHALGNYADAIELYRKVITFQPDSEEALYNLALALHAMNNFSEAFEVYHAVIRQWPAKDEAWYHLGLAYNAVKDFPQAISAFSEASRLNPESSDTWFELGNVYYTTEQYGEAIHSFRKVLARNPAMVEAWYNMGNAYLIWGEFSDAIDAYTKAAELRPDDYSVWQSLCSAYYSSGAYSKAVDAGSRALTLKEDDLQVIGTLGLSKLLSGDSAGASSLFNQLVAIDSAGGTIEWTATELRKAIAQRRTIAGAKKALQKLTGAS